MKERLFVVAAVTVIFASSIFTPLVFSAPPPHNSIYQLNAVLQDQNGVTQAWGDNQGRVRLMTMFYSNCPHTCPLIVEALKNIETSIPIASKERLGVDLISMDPIRDTPEVLKKMARSRDIDEKRWHLLRTNESNVRLIAAVLKIQYRQLPDGEFNHSSVILLIDTAGIVLARTDLNGANDEKFISMVASALAR
jgi:protein SCO1